VETETWRQNRGDRLVEINNWSLVNKRLEVTEGIEVQERGGVGICPMVSICTIL